tara:strand:- start:11970 stop:12908 length:939 start_codon:yes stop_codon:yes gene_type:complete
MYFVSLIYNQYKLYEKWNDQVEHYDIVKNFLINENTNAINKSFNNKKPIMWIHLDYKVNARQWENFFSRNSTKLNQPYLYLTLKSILNKCGNDFNVALIDDSSFHYLIPDFNIDFSKLSSPIKEHYRELALYKVMYYYGGFLVPPSFLCIKNIKPLYDMGLQHTDMFMMENKLDYCSNYKYAPDPYFMGCTKQSPIMQKIIQYMEILNSTDYTSQQDFIGQMQEQFRRLVNENKISTINSKHIGVQKKNKESVDISELFQSNEIDYCGELYGIYIPANELLKKTKYQWFLKLTVEEILSSNTIIAKYMITSC